MKESFAKVSCVIGIFMIVLSPTLGSGMANNYIRLHASYSDVNYYVMMVYNFSSMLRVLGVILAVPMLIVFLRKYVQQ